MATTSFFDECVPAQPGFSSSVAAVTIIPDAGRVAKAWMKWYTLTTKVRKVRFIKQMIADKIQKEAEGRTDIYDTIADFMKQSSDGLHNASQMVADAVTNPAKVYAGQFSTLSETDPSTQRESQWREENEMGNEGLEQVSLVSNNDSTHDNDDTRNEDIVHEAVGSKHNSIFPANVGKSANLGNDDIPKEGSIQVIAGSTHDSKSLGNSNSNNNNNPAIDNNDDRTNRKREENGLMAILTQWMGTDDRVAKENVIIDDTPEANIELQTLDKSDSDVEAQTRVDNCESPGQDDDDGPGDSPDQIESQRGEPDVRNFKYEDFNVVQYAKKLGFEEETQLIGIVEGLGIEAMGLFAKEYAQSSGNCCPFGTFPHEVLIVPLHSMPPHHLLCFTLSVQVRLRSFSISRVSKSLGRWRSSYGMSYA